jgi:hypothetical protein
MVKTSDSQTGFRKGVSGFPRDEMRNGGRAILAVLIFYVRIKIRVATIDTNHSVTDSKQTIAASIPKLAGRPRTERPCLPFVI